VFYRALNFSVWTKMILLLLLAWIQVVAAGIKPVSVDFSSPSIVSLDKSNFNKLVVTDNVEKSKKYSPVLWFVEFYAPWCPHCKQLAPIYSKLASRFSSTNDNAVSEYKYLTFANIPCPDNAEICDAQKIGGYPTLYLFKDGVFVEEYLEAYDETSLSKYLSELLNRYPPQKQIRKPPSQNPANVNMETTFIGKHVTELNDETFQTSIKSNIWFVEFFSPMCLSLQRIRAYMELHRGEICGVGFIQTCFY
jgi:thiol-disulfide isomerase/thioredoxin